MANITAALVKELRERTGLGMMECKKALVETEGNVEEAIDNLRKNSGMKAAKKAGRTAAEGLVAVKLSADGSDATIIEVNSETDFVARDDSFIGFVNTVLDASYAAKSNDMAAVMEGELSTVRDALVQKIGENISPRRCNYVGGNGSVVSGYQHGGRIGVLVELKGGDAELAKDIAMHVAAVNPQYIAPENVPASELEREKAVIIAQSEGSGKPAEIIEKMSQGRLKKFLAEVSLVEQPFVKDPDMKVGALLKKANAEIVSFTRYEVGEGIEVEAVDFAAEVAAQVGANK